MSMMITALNTGKVVTAADVSASGADVRTFENGLTVIVKEDRRSPVASVQAWCNTGSIHEDKWLGAGLSHILEHMLFKGTTTRNTSEITQSIQDEGGYVNAYTSFDRTVYWIDIPATGVKTALDILSDVMLNSTLPEDEYVKEQEVIRREFAMGADDPSRVGWKLLFDTAFAEHPYRAPVIGYLDVYNQLKRDDVMEYYRKRYVPNNLFFVVVGDVNKEEVFEQLEKAFEGVPRKALQPVFIPQEPEQLGKRIAHREFPSDLTRMNITWKIPGLTHDDAPALDLLSTVLGDGASSRLYQELREKQGVVHSVNALSYTPLDGGLFSVGVVCDPDKRTAAEEAVFEQIARVQKEGVTKEELEKARKQELSSQFQSLETMEGQASEIGQGWHTARNVNFSKVYLASLSQVSQEDVQRVANKYLIDQTLTITSLNPVGSLEKETEAKQKTEQGAVQKFILSNGVRLLVREDSSVPLVSASAMFEGGVSWESEQNSGITEIMARLMLRGTKNRTAEQIFSEIESVGGSIASNSGFNTFTIGTQMLNTDLALGLDILTDVISNPVFPEDALTREKQTQIAGIKAIADQPLRVAGLALRKELYGDHPYSKSEKGTEESVRALTRESVEAFYKKHAIPEHTVIAVFGDVKAKEVQELLEQKLTGFSRNAEERNPLLQPSALTENKTVVTEAPKEQAVLVVGFLGIDLNSPDRAALELINEACSDMGSRLFIRIREEMGLAYYVGSSMRIGTVKGSFAFYAGTDPEKLEEVQSALLEEIQYLAENGLTEEELQRAKRKYLGQELVQNQSNRALAQEAALDELLGLGYDHSDKHREAVETVTLEDVKRVTKKYFQDQKHAIAVVRPPLKNTQENNKAADAPTTE